MTRALSDLLTVQTSALIRQRILTGMKNGGLPVSDWAATAKGGLESALVDMSSQSLSDLAAANVVAGIAGGFLDEASGDWLAMLAKRFYQLDKNQATYTIQSITLTASAQAVQVSKQPGEVWVISSAGNRYQNIDAIELKPGASGQFNFQAENPGAAYADTPGTIATLVTSLPGVTALNARAFFAPQIIAGGNSRGTIIPTATPAPAVISADGFWIQILTSGQVGVAIFEWAIDGGKNWIGAALTDTSVDIGNGCTLLFTSAADASLSFIKGDVFFIDASPIIQQGSDTEADASLRDRCRARWPSLSDNITPCKAMLWARFVSPEITRVRVLADANQSGGMLVYIGSSAGKCSPLTIVAAQKFLTARMDQGEFVNVQSVDVWAISVTGTVQVPRDQLADIQTLASAAWAVYLASVPTGGIVRLAVLQQILKDAGAIDFASIGIGGSPNVVLGPSYVPGQADGTSLATLLNWEPIAGSVTTPSIVLPEENAAEPVLTPDAILAPPADADIKEKLLSVLRGIQGFPVTDWHVGGTTRTYVELEAVALSDLLQSALPGMFGAVYADGGSDAATRDWLTIVAKKLYNLTRSPAVVAVQNLTLTCDGSHGPYTITAGTFWAKSPITGNRWVAKTGGTLNTGSTLTISIAAEQPGSQYKDAAGTITQLLAPLPGVTISNAAADFTTPVLTGSSTGTVTPSRTSGGTPPTPTSFLLRIDAAGQVTAGAWSYSTDGGLTWTSAGTIVASYALPGGTTVAFANGAGTPSFAAGDVFAFATPGTAITTIGQDQEADVPLSGRCVARWPDLSVVPPSRYIKWAKAASANVTRVRLEEDPSYLGKLYLTLAGVAGAVSGGDVTAVQTYVDKLTPTGRILIARAATTHQITATGTVVVPRGRKAAIQAAAQIAWQAYVNSTDIGGIVQVSDLIRTIMDAGAIDFTSPALTGGSPNVSLSSTEVAILNTSTPLLANQLTWQEI